MRTIELYMTAVYREPIVPAYMFQLHIPTDAKSWVMGILYPTPVTHTFVTAISIQASCVFPTRIE